MTTMRIEDCGGVISSMTSGDRNRLTRYLRSEGLLRGRILDLHACCVRARLCQADIALALLRLNLIDVVERLIGKPITRCPPVRRRAGGRQPRTQPRVISVRSPSPLENGKRRLLGTGLYERLSRARVGMSVESMLLRGITRRDIRIAVRRGYVVLA